MSFFIGKLRVVDTRKDEKGNTYHITMNRSLLLTVFSEMGIKETDYKDKYYLNLVAVYKNSNLENALGSKDFSFKSFDMDFLDATAKDLLISYFKNNFKEEENNMTEEEIVSFCENLIDEVFSTNQKGIDEKVKLLNT